MRCRGCQERRANCHAHCEHYLAWRAEMDRLKAAEIRERQGELYAIEVGKERLRRQAVLRQCDRIKGRRRFKE